MRARLEAWLCGVLGYVVLAACAASAVSLLSWSIADPSFTHATNGPTRNLLGPVGAIFSDLIIQLLGLAGVLIVLPPLFWALQLIALRRLDSARVKIMLAPLAVVLLACAASSLPRIAGWPLPYNFGGLLGDQALRGFTSLLAMIRPERASMAAGLFCLAGGLMLLMTSLGLSREDLKLMLQRPRLNFGVLARGWQRLGEMSERATVLRREPTLRMPSPPPPMAPTYQPAAQRAAVPDPREDLRRRTYRPQLDQDAGISEAARDDDIDAKELARIATICAPKRAAKLAGAAEPSGSPAPPSHRAQTSTVRATDPIRAARDVLAAPGDAPDHAQTVIQAPAAPHRGTDQRPAWPAAAAVSPPLTMPASSEGWRPQSLPGGDDLYGRAVAIVLGDRKASTGYLQQRLAIGYMRAADLIERMEREGILGAPVYNGMRPILIGGPGSREI